MDRFLMSREKKKKFFVFHINEFHLQEKGLSRIKRNVSMC